MEVSREWEKYQIYQVTGNPKRLKARGALLFRARRRACPGPSLQQPGLIRPGLAADETFHSQGIHTRVHPACWGAQSRCGGSPQGDTFDRARSAGHIQEAQRAQPAPSPSPSPPLRLAVSPAEGPCKSPRGQVT